MKILILVFHPDIEHSTLFQSRQNVDKVVEGM